MNNFIEEWKNKRNSVKEQNKKLILKIAKQKAKEVNIIANQFHENVFKKINCLDCANCCTSIPPLVNETDAKRISKFLGIKLSGFKEEYITIDEDKDMVMKIVPCVFLESNNKCRIYEVRPKACREYPHTDNFEFMKNLKLHLTNTTYCPAVYHILKAFKQ
jgi:Fe-S-cluster containining protein